MRSPDNDTEGPTRAETSAETDARQTGTRRRWERRRASDKVALVALAASIFAISVCAGLSLVAITNSVRIHDFRELQKEARAETRMRVDASCLIFERSHLADVNQLRDTYRYLLTLPPGERSRPRDPLNKFVLSQLPEAEQNAKIDTAPKYCDAPGYGLPEPDPVIPKRPKGLADVGRLP